jgi:hypothetical protein
VFVVTVVLILGFIVAVMLGTGTVRWGLGGLEGAWVARGLPGDSTQQSDQLTVRFGEASTVRGGGPTEIMLSGTLAGERFLCVTDVSDWSVVSQSLHLDDERWTTVEKDGDVLIVTGATGETVTLASTAVW